MANRNGLKWQIPFLLLLIVGTVLILRKQAPYQTDQGLVFGTMYKITLPIEREPENGNRSRTAKGRPFALAFQQAIGHHPH